MLVVQMAGRPGVGKSTIARAVGAHFDAFVIDHDVTKSALLDLGVSWDEAGRIAWGLNFALAEELLRQRRSVVLDNPSHYPRVPERGVALASRFGATYAMIECRCDDDDEVERRLRSRPRLRSHMTGLGEWPAEASQEPSTAIRLGRHDFLIYRAERNVVSLDVLGPLDAAIEMALKLLRKLERWPDSSAANVGVEADDRSEHIDLTDPSTPDEVADDRPHLS